MSRRAALAKGHPCHTCDVSEEAVCRVFNTDELAEFRDHGTSTRLTPGQALFHEGDPADAVFSLTAGTLKLYTLLPDGRRQVTGFLFPGDFLGIGHDTEYRCTAEAVSHAELCRFQSDWFERQTQAHPRLFRALYQRTAEELALVRAQIVMLGRKNAVERLASFLRDIHGRARQHGSRPARLLSLPMSRLDIADYLGITRETVSRCLATLKTARIIRSHSINMLEILDLERIDQLACGRDA